ncbi:phage tail protein [Chitinophaga sp. 30R24]|uniref:phage tail protein n=1 Tax=Chitinophaga sp. 30R24 TaxID=3248838 RepID=UPI003B8F2276
MAADDPFVGEICMFAFNFPPRGWSECNGQLLPISSNTALFSLLGTTYGGDGRASFALPNLAGQVLIGAGQGPGLTDWYLGATGGTDTVTLTSAQLPTHTHTIANRPLSLPAGDVNNTYNPVGSFLGTGAASDALYNNTSGAGTMAPINHSLVAGTVGNAVPLNNMQPSVTMIYAIAMQGVFPPRS